MASMTRMSLSLLAPKISSMLARAPVLPPPLPPVGGTMRGKLASSARTASSLCATSKMRRATCGGVGEAPAPAGAEMSSVRPGQFVRSAARRAASMSSLVRSCESPAGTAAAAAGGRSSPRSARECTIAAASAKFSSWCDGRSHVGSAAASAASAPASASARATRGCCGLTKQRGAPSSEAVVSITARASAVCETEKAGTPRLTMPALCQAISRTECPSTATWSMPTRHRPATAGSGTWLVQSKRPPSPVSSTATSTLARRKHTSASAVSFSKGVNGTSTSTCGRSSAHAASTSCLLTSAPSIRMRSRQLCRCGLVKSPTRASAPRSILSQIALVVPFPLVPATCTTHSPSCGSPSAASSCVKRTHRCSCGSGLSV
mmetsp:Transcript_26596/g.67400  ORF Transcript_26596/g.67400 Transcript_26596/m.67400 type:complete len:376 (-) Transcript_26596:118-1245(-)